MSNIIATREAYVEEVVIQAGTPNEYINHYRHAREVDVRCECGRIVTCSAREFTVTCECGADYNGSGSRLAPRSQWGEECSQYEDDDLPGMTDDDYQMREWSMRG